MHLTSKGFASSRLAPTVKMVNHIVAAIAHPLCKPPMWKILAQCRRMASGKYVGTEQNIVKSRLTTGSERISTAMQRLAAVAVAISASTYLASLILRYSMKQATATFAITTREKNFR